MRVLTTDKLPWLLHGATLLASLPLIRWLFLAWSGALGVNPIEFLTRSTGIWTLVMLLLTLSVTPLRRLLNAPLLIRIRRRLGLWTFFYASLHLLTWITWEHWFDWAAMLQDVWQRTFIWVGLLAWALMLLLALTSNAWSMRGLGRNWARLHLLVHAIAALGIWHFVLHRNGKNDYADPIWFGSALAVLWLARAAWILIKRQGEGVARKPISR